MLIKCNKCKSIVSHLVSHRDFLGTQCIKCLTEEISEFFRLRRNTDKINDKEVKPNIFE